MTQSCVHIWGWLKSLLTLFALPVCSMIQEGSSWSSHNSACARCRRQITPMEELVLQFYPGLFSPTPPSLSETDQDTPDANFVYSGSAEIHRPIIGNSARDLSGQINSSKRIHDANNTRRNSTRVPKSSNKGQLWDSHKDPTLNDLDHVHKSSPSCCETVLEYVTPSNVTIQGKVYRVVHLRNAFQFIPVAKCKSGTKCMYGECVERYRAHWVLIYNTTQPHTGPPVNFTPLEVPSHCECLNVGKP